jgi:eukaryotic-like serine/threonine-protein kinase
VSSREAQAGPTSSPPAQRGERFASGLRVRGRYRVVSEIGSGAFGTVCLGEDESTGHRVAIRFLPQSFATTPQASQAVLRIGRSIIAGSTSHPAIARVLEFGELDAGRPFTVTEFVEGRRLSELMSGRAPLEIHAALRIALELGGAVETLHNMGFVHGAINPHNVVVLEDGRVKLLDVELAGLRDAREVQGLVSTDPAAEYLSPEQIQKAPTTEKTDIYAVGVILYELLSGAPPFEGSARDAICAKHLKDAPVPVHRRREGIPASVSRAVTLALYKQPEARPLMGDVLNLLWTGAHGPAPQRKRAAVILGGAALAALAVAAVVWGVLSLRPPGGSSLPQPTARPTIEPAPSALAPAPAPPSVETRKPPTPAVVTPREATGRAVVTESSPSNVRAPETSAAPAARPSAPPAPAPTVSAPVAPPPVERATPAARPPSAAAPTENRPAPGRATPPTVAPPAVAAPPPPARPAAPPAPVATSPAQPAPPAPPQVTAPVAPRAERREQPAPAPPPAPSREPDDSTAAIDWLLKSR